MTFSCLPPRKFSQKILRLPLLTKAKNMIIISLSKKSLWTFSPSCFQNCKIEFCIIILQFCRCGGLWNAKGHPDGFLSHYPSLRNYRLGRFFYSLKVPRCGGAGVFLLTAGTGLPFRYRPAGPFRPNGQECRRPCRPAPSRRRAPARSCRAAPFQLSECRHSCRRPKG